MPCPVSSSSQTNAGNHGLVDVSELDGSDGTLSSATFGSSATLRRSKLSLVESFSLSGDVYEIPGRVGTQADGCEVCLNDQLHPSALLVCWRGIEGCTSVVPWHPSSSRLLDAANLLLYTCDSE